MKKRTLSIISELLFILIGVFFVVNALALKPAKNYYESPALYPLLVSAALIITSCVALIKDMVKKGPERTEIFDIPNPKGLLAAIVILVVMKLIWQYLDMFYLAIFLGVWAMLFLFHDIDKTKKQRLIFATAGSVVFTAAAWLIFTMILSIKF